MKQMQTPRWHGCTWQQDVWPSLHAKGEKVDEYVLLDINEMIIRTHQV